MNETTRTKKTTHWLIGATLVAIGHLAGIAVVAMGIALLFLPISHMQGLAGTFDGVPWVWEQSRMALLLHIGLSACVWGFSWIIFQLARLRIAERREQFRRPIRLSRGSVMTETVIVMPILLILIFGMGQLAVNNIGAILANVAAYEAARAAWVWQPEEDLTDDDRRLGVGGGVAEEKCRIAVALAMLPIAPGDYFKLDDDVLDLGGSYAERARVMAGAASFPGYGLIETTIGPTVTSVADVVAGLASIGDTSLEHSSYAKSLDGSLFIIRTVRKFTAAFLAAECAIQGDHSVNMTYHHLIAMPVVGYIFGNMATHGGRSGYYTDYERSFGFKKQVNLPSNKMPQNNWISWQSDVDQEDTDFDTGPYEP